MPRETERPAEPGLVLVVEERPASGGWVYDLRLQVTDRELLAGLKYPTFGTVSFKSEPAEFFRRHLKTIGAATPSTVEEKAAFAETVLAAGAYLSDQILPVDIRRCLAALRGRLPALHIVSDAPWIPWELLRIGKRSASRRIDGPHLCEVYTVTRGLKGLALPSRFPLTSIGVVLRGDQGLTHLSQEWQDLQNLEIPGRRKVVRIPAHLQAILAAFQEGEHDGWHFGTHGTFQHTVPDLSEIQPEKPCLPSTWPTRRLH
jgi:hypothetical protein